MNNFNNINTYTHKQYLIIKNIIIIQIKLQ